MAGITVPAIDRYLESLLPEREPLLAEMEAQASEQRLPIVGPVEARLLFTLARLSGARRVLELGACSGYSALWLAEAVAPSSGTVETIELDPRRAALVEGNVARSRAKDRIRLLRGDALEILPTLERGAYDLIFNDLLRSGAGETNGVPNQVRFLALSLPLLRSGGLLLSDNVLCDGQVTETSPRGAAAGIAEYNRRLASHPDLETSFVPIRDGVAISINR
ncbi:MAG TPA: O-methyltransferase [Chloroflexota bacterium]|nr:O-methyltransferase [Chloroflexota bacterium]